MLSEQKGSQALYTPLGTRPRRIIGTVASIIKARDFRRLASAEERWSPQRIRSVAGTPWEPKLGRMDDTIPVRVHTPEEGDDIAKPPEAEDNKEPSKRRARITREDIVRLGFTLGCPGCKAISRNAPAQNHTELCRDRIEKEVIKE